MNKLASYAVVMALSAGVTWFATSHYYLSRHEPETHRESLRPDAEGGPRSARVSAPSTGRGTDLNDARRRPQRVSVSPPASDAILIGEAERFADAPPPAPPPAVVAIPVAAVGTAPAPVPVAAVARTLAWIRYEQTLPGKGSKCRIDGTSSIHDWKMETPIIAGTFEFDARATFDPLADSVGPFRDGIVPARAEARIPVRTVKSASVKMDEVYKAHMEEAKYKQIGFRLLQLQATTHQQDGAWVCDATGGLTIHGVSNLVTLPVTIASESPDQLKVNGKTTVQMSDYGLTAPAPEFDGVTRQFGDAVTISFTWVLRRAGPNP